MADYSIEVAIPTAVTQSVTAADLEVTDATKGLILRNANGTRYRLTIDNDGILTATAL